MLAFKKDGVTLFGFNPDKIVDISPHTRTIDGTPSYRIVIFGTEESQYTIKFKVKEEATAFMDNLILCCNQTHTNYIVNIGNGEL